MATAGLTVVSTAAVLTASDGVASGTRADRSGDLVAQMLTDAGFEVVRRLAVADDVAELTATIRHLTEVARLVVTTGGTGFGPRDVTPEATRSVIEREATGLTHLLFSEGIRQTPMAALSRAVAGTIGTTLVINLPGSPRAVEENLSVVLPLVGHVLDLLEGRTEHG